MQRVAEGLAFNMVVLAMDDFGTCLPFCCTNLRMGQEQAHAGVSVALSQPQQT